MKISKDQGIFFNLIKILCDDCWLQVTISVHKGIWSFNFYDHPDFDTELSWDVKGRDPNKILIEFIPVLIIHFEKVRKIRKQEMEDDCVKFCDKSLEKLYWLKDYLIWNPPDQKNLDLHKIF